MSCVLSEVVALPLTSKEVNQFCARADCAVVGYQLSEWHDFTLQMLSAVT